MDILIKGIKKLPQDGDYIHLIIQNGKVHTAISCGYLTTDKLNVGTVVALPPHGDLIDKASVLSLLRYYCEMREYKKEVRCEDCENRNACVVRPIMDEVNKLDTVLEACI